MRVQIVLPDPEREWILGKIADRLVEYASAEDINISVGPDVDSEAGVNHYLPWWAAHGRLVDCSLLMVTHIDPTPEREGMARELCAGAAHVTVMSQQSKERLQGWGIPADKITVAHVGVDPGWQPRDIKVGLIYRIYRDGRKNEGILLELADHMDLSGFWFILVGTGWEGIFESLQERGVKVSYYDTQSFAEGYKVHRELVPMLDYWLYTGQWDEGPMGMLDALAAGVQCILPPHGYCTEAAPYAHFYEGLEELAEVFETIKLQRWRHRWAIQEWTWDNYGKLHQGLYRRIANGQASDT